MQKSIQIDDFGTKNIIRSDSDFFIFVNELVNIITNKYESNMITSLVKNNYEFLSPSEQILIEKNSKCKLNEHRFEIQKYIFDKMAAFIRNEERINLRGFVLFRLKEYTRKIETAVEEAVGEFISEREYDELISGLILYIELQPPMAEVLNIIRLTDKYVLTDENNREVLTLSQFDDVLLDALLTLSPERLQIYNPQNFPNKKMLDTIKRIFGNRVMLINDV